MDVSGVRNRRYRRKKRTSKSLLDYLIPQVEQLLQTSDGNLYDSDGEVNKDELILELKKAHPVHRNKRPSTLLTATTQALDILKNNQSEIDIPVSIHHQAGADFTLDSITTPSSNMKFRRPNLLNASLTNLYQSPDGDARSTPHNTHSPNNRNSNSKGGFHRPTEHVQTPSGTVLSKRRSRGHKRSADDMGDERKPQQPDNSVDGEIEQTLKKRMKRGKDITLHQPSIKFSDVGGLESVLEEICKLLMHLKHPEVYKQLGVMPPRGFLLHGPPGCGKTLLAHAIAGQLEIPLIKVAAPEIIAGVSGESEERIRELFDKAVSSAPCILFIDEIDAITPKRETAQKEMERRIVAQLLISMDDLSQKELAAEVLVVGATNRPDSLDPALRRAGRFDREIALGIPDESARERILKVLCNKLKLEDGFNFRSLAHKTPGYVGADLVSLTREAAMSAVTRAFRLIEDNFLKADTKENTGVKECTSEEKLNTDNATTILSASYISLQTEVHTEQEPEESLDNLQAMESVHISKECTEKMSDGTSETVEVNNHGDSKFVDDKQNKVLPLEKPSDTVVFNRIQANLSNLKTTNDFNKKLDHALMLLGNLPPLDERQLNDLFVSMKDFESALKVVQPSAKREGFATIPDVTWDDVGALTKVREALQMAILAPVHHREKFELLGLTTPSGILLYGPPGCGKTLLAKAIANESGINFISVKGPELLNMYVGESERAVRQCFQRAKHSAPCVIFFDEIDALCPRRSDSADGGASSRVVNQLLTEMDGLESRRQVFVLAATNRPDIIDPAMLRPGRLDEVLFIGLPTSEERLDILKTITRNGTKPPFADDVSLKAIAEDKRCEHFSGADLAALVRQASLSALTHSLQNYELESQLVVKLVDFDVAFEKVKPSNKR